MVHAEINDFWPRTTGTSAETDLQKSRLLFHFEKYLIFCWFDGNWMDHSPAWEILHQEVQTANPKNSDVQIWHLSHVWGTKFESKCKWTQYPPDQAPSHGTQYVSSPYWHSKPRHDHIYTGGYVVTVGKVMGIYTFLLLFNKLWGQHNISKIWSWKYKWYKALFVFRKSEGGILG